MIARKKLWLSVVGMAVAFAANALGYRLEGERWTLNATVLMHLSLGGNLPLSDGFNSFNESAADALRIWNQYLAHMQFAVDSPSILPPANNDGDNSAFFSGTVYGMAFGSDAVAATIRTVRGSGLTEADVIFNTLYRFDSYRGPFHKDVYDLHRVALHEFGHVLGLDHTDRGDLRPMPIMATNISNTDSLQLDDIAGARSLYAIGPAYRTIPQAPNLMNISTRCYDGLGDNVMIAGFIIAGSQPATVVIRGIGHSLAAYGLPNALHDPVLELHDQSGATIASNDYWLVTPNAQAIASYHLNPSNGQESALYATLAPGSYTAILKSFSDASQPATVGEGLVEVYDLHTSTAHATNISTRALVLTGNDVLIGGFIIGPGASKQLILRALGPSLANYGVPSPLADPTLDLRNANGVRIDFNNEWQTGPAAATIVSRRLAPRDTRESALLETLVPGAYTAIVSGANRETGVALFEVYDQSGGAR